MFKRNGMAEVCGDFHEYIVIGIIGYAEATSNGNQREDNPTTKTTSITFDVMLDVSKIIYVAEAHHTSGRPGGCTVWHGLCTDTTIPKTFQSISIPFLSTLPTTHLGRTAYAG